MQKRFTHLAFLLIVLSCVTACQEGNFRYIEPVTGKNCQLIKEYSYSNGKRYLLNEYSYLDSNHVASVKHYSPTEYLGQTQFEYDTEGRLVKIYDKIPDNNTGKSYDGYLVYGYDANGNVIEIKGYNTENSSEVLIQHMLLYYNAQNQVDRVISSYGSLTRLEYDEKGNVARVFFTPYLQKEYLREEYTSYNNKTPDSLNQILTLRNIFMNPIGCNYSQNQALAYKMYNPDGSLNQNYNQRITYDRFGNYIKLNSNHAGTGALASNTVIEAEYKCRF